MDKNDLKGTSKDPKPPVPEKKEAPPDNKGLRERDIFLLTLQELQADEMERAKQGDAQMRQEFFERIRTAIARRDAAVHNAVSEAVNPAVTAAVRGVTVQAARVPPATEPPTVDPSQSDIKPF